MPSESRMTAVPRSYTHRWYDAHRVVIALVSFVVAILGVVSMVIWSGLAAATMENAVQNVKIEHIDVALDGVRSRQQGSHGRARTPCNALFTRPARVLLFRRGD